MGLARDNPLGIAQQSCLNAGHSFRNKLRVVNTEQIVEFRQSVSLHLRIGAPAGSPSRFVTEE